MFSLSLQVFEGNHSFTSSITEYADGLYAAAASLGIYIQLFYSHSAESTGEIILNCIRLTKKFTKNLYPPMPESETLAECFLTKFPSINPLSAHAIISSGNSLIEFFQMPRKVRLQVLNKYHVPEVSINLLSVLCKFGEREDSRSGTTDCSSVSSASDSEYFRRKIGLGGTKRKFSASPSNDGIVMDKSLQYEHSNRLPNASLIPPKTADPFLSRISADPNASTNFAKVSSCLDNSWLASHGGGKSISADELFAVKFKSADTGETSIGEADFDPTGFLDNTFFPFEKSRTNSPLHGKRKAPEPKNPGIARRLSFDAVSDHTFSKVDLDFSPKKNDWNYNFKGTETRNTYRCTDVESHDTPSRAVPVHLDQSYEPKAKRFQFHPPTYHVADTSPYIGTPLRNAIDSFKLQQGSPWTIEFLNRVREKSIARKNSLPCAIFPPKSAQRGTKHHTTKRKSPSIIDFYRYQGGSSAQKTFQRKSRLQDKEPLRSTERVDASASRTPVDKLARKVCLNKPHSLTHCSSYVIHFHYLFFCQTQLQALSFTVGNHGSQSKLVWLDGSI